MRYVLLLYGNEKEWLEATEEQQAAAFAAHGEYTEMLRSRNAMQGGEALAPTTTATTIRKRNGTVTVTDGPFAETAEQIGGFYLVEAKDLDEALELARALPEDVVEVRPTLEGPA